MATQQGSKSSGSNENANFGSFASDAFKQFQNMPGVDMNQLMDQYKKNMEVFSEIQHETMESAKKVSQIQSEYARQAMEDYSSYMRNLMTSGNNMKDKVDIQTAALQQGIEKSMNYGKQMTETISKSSEKLTKMYQQKYSEFAKKAECMAKDAHGKAQSMAKEAQSTAQNMAKEAQSKAADMMSKKS